MRSETRCVKDIMKEFRAVQKGKNHYDKKTRKMRKPEEIIMHDSFRKKMNALQVNLKSQTAQDSRQVRALSPSLCPALFTPPPPVLLFPLPGFLESSLGWLLSKPPEIL
eukprot:COSAG04_NODE_3953_length_2400_cov_6.429813_3_plen_109_part_00